MNNSQENNYGVPNPNVVQKNTSGIGSLVCGIVGLVLAFLGTIFSIVGIILGLIAIILAIKGMKKGKNGKLVGGLVCGIIGFIIGIIYTVILVIAVLAVNNTVEEVNEAAIKGSVGIRALAASSGASFAYTHEVATGSDTFATNEEGSAEYCIPVSVLVRAGYLDIKDNDIEGSVLLTIEYDNDKDYTIWFRQGDYYIDGKDSAEIVDDNITKTPISSELLNSCGNRGTLINNL